MATRLEPGTEVLISPRWTPGRILSVEGDRVLVSTEDGRMPRLPHKALALRGVEPSAGDEVLVEVGGSRRRGRVLDVRTGRARVEVDDDAQWHPMSSLAVFVDEELPRGDASPPRSANGRDGRQVWWWRNSSLVVLGFGVLGLVFGLVEGLGGWAVALSWFMLHAILAAYVLCHDHVLPRFHPAGLGKPSDPGFSMPGFVLERPPLRSQWELVLLMIAGWLTVGLGMNVGGSRSIGPLSVCVIGIITAALAHAHDRGSAREARRLLAATPIRSRSHSGEGRLVGTVADDAGAQPVLWREVLQLTWSVSRQVTKTITDQDGRQRTVQETETSHYACGFRRERKRPSIRIETALGTVEVPVRGIVWAAERTLSFEPGAQGWRPPKPTSEALRQQTRFSTLERIHAGQAVAVLGELRQDGGALPRIIGGEAGPAVLLAATEGDPVAVLARAVLQRRVLLASMVVLGLASLLAI